MPNHEVDTNTGNAYRWVGHRRAILAAVAIAAAGYVAFLAGTMGFRSYALYFSAFVVLGGVVLANELTSDPFDPPAAAHDDGGQLFLNAWLTILIGSIGVAGLAIAGVDFHGTGPVVAVVTTSVVVGGVAGVIRADQAFKRRAPAHRPPEPPEPSGRIETFGTSSDHRTDSTGSTGDGTRHTAAAHALAFTPDAGGWPSGRTEARRRCGP